MAAPLRWRDELAIGAVVCAVAALGALGGWAWRLDRVVYDLGLSLWSRPAPADVLIVAIDDRSLQAIGRWPWRRAIHATLLEKLAAARPRAVALDLVLAEPDADPRQDALLAAAMRHAAPLVLPVAGALPDPAFRGSALLGAAEPAVDADGVLRHAYLQAGPPDRLLPHAALVLLKAGGEAPHPGLPLRTGPATAASSAWQRESELLVRYVGPPGTVQRVSYVDVLTGEVPASRLAGRYVLVGMTAEGLGDTLATPVNAHHRAMPGIEVLANVLHTLRSGDALRPLDEAAVAALSCALLVALLLAFGTFGARLALPLALASVPLALLASLLALRAGWWASPVPYALGAALAYPLWSWRRLERAVAGLDAEIARLAAEPLVAAAASPAAPAGAGDAIDARLHTLQGAGAALRQAQRFLADTLAALPTAVLVADAQARVQLANPRAAALFEVEAAAELQGLDLLRLLGEFDAPGAPDWRSAITDLQGREAGLAVEGRLAGRDFVLHLAAVDLQDRRMLVLSVADVQPVKQAQQEREEALAFVSHDLRSPAQSIVMLADMQLSGAPPEGAPAPSALLHEVRRLALRTLQLSDGFVRAAHARTQALQLAPVALPALLEEAVADLRPQAEAAGVAVQLRLPEAPPAVTLDAALVGRAVANLVSNAVKHSPRGGAVQVQAAFEDQRLRVQVRDQGPGLTPRQLAQLAQGDEGAPVHDARGVGLGLLFVQRVARRHGGALRALTPSNGGGAWLELELPA